MTTTPPKTYLGDAVYAEWEEGMLKLTTSNGIYDTNTIYLDWSVLPELKRYMAAAEAQNTLCPFCKFSLDECACEEPEAEPVRCVECGMPLLYCECDVKILEEEA
jgi:hypothetical protein